MPFTCNTNCSNFSTIISIILLFSLSACQTKAQRTSKFVLSKDSTFIGTWEGYLVDAQYKEDTTGAIFSFYCKDSIIYQYFAYCDNPSDVMEGQIKTDSTMLASLMAIGRLKKYTDRKHSLYGMHDYFGNDSVLVVFDTDSPLMDPKEKRPFFERLMSCYIINADNSLSLVHNTKWYNGVEEKKVEYTFQQMKEKK
jgi:hypothetical protein